MTRLSQVDYRRFRQFADQRPTCYANGWLYHLRSSRNENGSIGYQYSSSEYLATVGLRQAFTTCVSPMGQQRFTETPRLCEAVARKTRRPILLKKVDSDLHAHLLECRGFSRCHDEKFLEDETFPENLLNLDRLFDDQGRLNPNATQLRRRVRQFENHENQLNSLSGSENSNVDLASALGHMLADSQCKFLAYNQICQFVQSASQWADDFFLTTFFDKQNKIHGVYVAEKLANQVAGLYCAVTSRAYPNATEWMDVVFFRSLHQGGFQQLMLGGSETAGVHHYVQKLLPIQLNNSMQPLFYEWTSSSL